MAMGDCRGEGGGLEGLLVVKEGLGGDVDGSEGLLMVMEDLRDEESCSKGSLVSVEDVRGEVGSSEGLLVMTEVVVAFSEASSLAIIIITSSILASALGSPR